MGFFISHPISTRDVHISPKALAWGPDIGRGLIWDVIWKSPYYIVFIIYFTLTCKWKNVTLSLIFLHNNNLSLYEGWTFLFEKFDPTCGHSFCSTHQSESENIYLLLIFCKKFIFVTLAINTASCRRSLQLYEGWTFLF